MATTIAAIVLTAISTAMIYSFKNAAQARYRDTATGLAQEIVEFFRRERAAEGWGGFLTALNGTETYCILGELDDSVQIATLSSSPCGAAEPIGGASYRRDATVAYPDASTVKLTVIVSWQTGEEEWQEVVIEQLFKKWD